MYLDVKNFKWITLSKLSVNVFKWIKIKFKFDEDFIKNYDEERYRIFSRSWRKIS